MTRSEYLSTLKINASRGSDLPQSKLNPELVREIRTNQQQNLFYPDEEAISCFCGD